MFESITVKQLLILAAFEWLGIIAYIAIWAKHKANEYEKDYTRRELLRKNRVRQQELLKKERSKEQVTFNKLRDNVKAHSKGRKVERNKVTSKPIYGTASSDAISIKRFKKHKRG